MAKNIYIYSKYCPLLNKSVASGIVTGEGTCVTLVYAPLVYSISVFPEAEFKKKHGLWDPGTHAGDDNNFSLCPIQSSLQKHFP
jgi:hypothetical protein